jgi:hypothetical protein
MVINTTTGEQAIVNKGISANLGSGGVHRAHQAAVLAWADLSGDTGGGRVYIIKFR